ncbi:hypothetical protein [Bacillus sp. S/N-304-OC-R1]|uniref:hypothetical protein n=1 Tax=Bacillus sp. S/N-304-OC-R1 TaxID=2758034 RepID=UPI001C8E6A60|nr:hypothetical protein [Bacillus sp. S/N-304-OC-R1]MBY0122384.1 endolytic transglycosylase MltG [Bacillus sp. S/N-304-OC-R1]
MNKRNTRAFALGILVAVCIIGSYYYYVLDRATPDELNIVNAKDLLADQGYIILTKEKYQNMEEAIKEKNKEAKATQQDPATPQKEEDTIHAYKLEIAAGMVSHEIASLLEQKKIIDDANEFETYLEENGYSKRIQLGKFELTAGMSYKQIAKIITKS